MRLTLKAKILALLVVAWFTPEILALMPVILGIGAAMVVVLAISSVLELSLTPNPSRGWQVQR